MSGVVPLQIKPLVDRGNKILALDILIQHIGFAVAAAAHEAGQTTQHFGGPGIFFLAHREPGH